MIRRRVDNRARRTTLRRATAVSAVAAFASAPVWYLLRGSFGAFWASWWTYASYQFRGIGLSFAQELSRGGNNFYGYYRHRPLLFVMIVAFVCITITEWLRFDRKTADHPPVVDRLVRRRVVPARERRALLDALLLGDRGAYGDDRRRARGSCVGRDLAAPMVGAHDDRPGRCSPSCSRSRCRAAPRAGWSTASSMLSDFTSVHRAVQLERADQPGPNQSVQAVLDLVSRDRDPLLAFSDDQFLYPSYRRIPATRFQQRYFLIGSIYLGQTGPQYILHNTWKWFDEDLRQANPATFLKTVHIDSKPFATYVARALQARVRRERRNGRAPQRRCRVGVARRRRRRSWTPPTSPRTGTGWTIDGSSAAVRAGHDSDEPRRVVTYDTPCERIRRRAERRAADASPDRRVPLHTTRPAVHRSSTSCSTATYASVEDACGGALDTIPTRPGQPAARCAVADRSRSRSWSAGGRPRSWSATASSARCRSASA